jgi:hypothetical protein
MYKSYRLKKAHNEPFLRKNTDLMYHMTAIPNPPSKDGVNSLLIPRLRGEDLKNSILKLPLKLFYLATRNAQQVTPPVLKIRGWILGHLTI